MIWCHQGERSADFMRFLLNLCPVLRYYYSHTPTLKPFPWLWSIISASTGWHLCALISWNKPLHKHDICQKKLHLKINCGLKYKTGQKFKALAKIIAKTITASYLKKLTPSSSHTNQLYKTYIRAKISKSGKWRKLFFLQ